MSKKVFITGGTGFLGAYIIKQLSSQGYSIRALRRSKSIPSFIAPHYFENVEWVHGDLLDIPALEDAMTGVDAVIHAAAKVSFHKSARLELYKTNVDGTANVVNAALLTQVPRMLYVSSVAALGRTTQSTDVTEERKWEDSAINTTYAISKHLAETEVWRGMGEGLNVVIVNPSTILGYGDWHNSSCAIFKTVYNEFPWYTNGVNGFVDVEDTARAIVTLMESPISNERFIINGDNWSFKQLLETIADGFQKRRPYREATPLLGAIAWRMEKLKYLFTGNKPLLTRESARVAQSRTYFNNSKILNQLPGFTFTPLAESIQKACELYARQS